MLVKTPLYRAWKNSLSTSLKKRRMEKILELTGLSKHPDKLKILELGCANGKDALQFMDDDDRYELYGVDINAYRFSQQNITFVQSDASALPFEDGSFDLVISIGLLEHIEPIEKLSDVIKEIGRVGKSHASVMPSVSTWLEPHTVTPWWPLRLHKEMVHRHSADQILHLNFFADHTWTKFEGFADAEVARFGYIPGLIKNTIVFKRYS